MTMRTTRKTVTFHRPFYLKGVDRLLPPADYQVATDEELIDGLSFAAYHRLATVIFVPAESGCAVEMTTIDPLDLQAAVDRDLAAERPVAIELTKRGERLMDEVDVTRNGRTNQFSITMVRGGDTIRCMVSVASGVGADERSDGDKRKAALTKAKALAQALNTAIESL